MESTAFSVTLTLRDGYAFEADFGEDTPGDLLFDEPRPLGAGSGPNALRVLAAAVANCLAASLLFCLRRARVDVLGMHAKVSGSLARNAQGRLRVEELRVQLEPDVPPEQWPRVERCQQIFRDFCIVSQSVERGIAITADVVRATEAVPAGVGGDGYGED